MQEMESAIKESCLVACLNHTVDLMYMSTKSISLLKLNCHPSPCIGPRLVSLATPCSAREGFGRGLVLVLLTAALYSAGPITAQYSVT